MIPGEKISIDNIDNLINSHMAFIIRTTSSATGRYVSVTDDDAFSIALSAFTESVSKYDPDKGPFLAFAKLVISSRLKTFMTKESSAGGAESLEFLREQGLDFSDRSQENTEIREEIVTYKEELLKFGLTLETLADTAPHHRDTKKRALAVAEKAGNDEQIVKLTYAKRKLPVRAVAKAAAVTEKIVKGSKTFILGALLIFANRLPLLKAFIGESR